MAISAIETLNRLMQGANLKKDNQLAAVLGVSPQAVSQARNKGKIPENWIIKIAEQYNLSTDWIFFGKNSSLPSAQLPKPAFAKAPSPAKRQPRATKPDPAAKIAAEIVMVPLVNARLAAGSGSLETGGEVQNFFAFRQDWLQSKGNPAKMVLMKVLGDSMEPDIRHGDMVLVNQGQTNIFGHAIYAVGVEEEIYIKQVETRPGGTLILRSQNPRYDPIEVNLRGDLADAVRIIGRVIWWCREA